MRPESVRSETPDAMIAFEDSQEQLKSLSRVYIDIFTTSVQSLSAQVEPMVIEIDRAKWEVPRNRLPPRNHRIVSGVKSTLYLKAIVRGDSTLRQDLERWPILNMLETLTWLGTMKCTCFDLLDFRAGYN